MFESPSHTSACVDCTRAGTCCEARSGGASTTRRATPSSSSSARAAVSGLRTDRNTDLPRSRSRRRCPKSEARPNSLSATVNPSEKRRQVESVPHCCSDSQSHSASLARAWLVGGVLLAVVFVQLDEVAERDGKSDRFGRIEGVKAERILQPCHDEREAQGIQSRLQQPQIVRQRRELAVLLLCDLLKMRRDGGAQRHLSTPDLLCTRLGAPPALYAAGCSTLLLAPDTEQLPK